MSQLFTPSGKAIVGTFEKITGCAKIIAAEPTDPNGTKEKFSLQYEGTTEVYWNDQTTVLDAETGERIFVDEDGVAWLESVLVLKDPD